MSQNNKPLIDRMIAKVSPRWAASRAYYREAADTIPKFGSVYQGGLQTRLDTPWSTSVGYIGANSTLNRWRLTKLRDRARDLERNNAIACGMLDRSVENVIGRGFKLQATTDNEAFNTQVEEMWLGWTESCDIRGMFSWSELQRTIYRARLRDGDVGVAFVQRGTDYKLQTVRGDYIDTVSGGYDLAGNVYDGIRFNPLGRPLEFSVLTIKGDGQRDSQWVPARDFVFMPRLKDPNQVRGEPVLAPVFKLFDQVDAYIEAVVVAARVAACQSLLIKSQNAGKMYGGAARQQGSNGQYQAIEQMEPGQVRYLQPNEDVVQVNPQQPTHSFPDFVAALLRFAGVTMGLPLELVLLDFSRTNYSSARASLLQAYRAFQTEQQIFIDQFLKRVYRWRVSKWVKDGDLVVPPEIEGNFWKHNWLAPGWAWVDPVKEINAAMMAVDAGFDTMTNIAAQHSIDFADLVKTRKREIALADGIPLSRSTNTRDPLVTPGVSAGPMDDPSDDSPDSQTGTVAGE